MSDRVGDYLDLSTPVPAQGPEIRFLELRKLPLQPTVNVPASRLRSKMQIAVLGPEPRFVDPEAASTGAALRVPPLI